MTVSEALLESNKRRYTKKAHNNLLIIVLMNVLLLFPETIPVHAQPIAKDLLSNFNQCHSFLNIQLPPGGNPVNTLFQDEQGLIWIGTNKGIFYYDGYDTHKLTITTETASYNVTAILQLDEKHLCIGTLQGLFLFNLFTEQYDALYPGMEAINSVTAMCLFSNKLWIGTPEGSICYYDFAQQALHELSSEEKEENKIIHVFEPTNDKLYIGSYKGLSVYDPLTNTLKNIPFPSSKGQSMITSLIWDKEENGIWVGTETNFFWYSKKDKSMTAFPLPVITPIESLKLDKQHNLLMGTINGLYVYNKTSRQTHHLTHSSRNSQSLCNNLIRCCYIDNNNNIWLGTGNGISLAPYNPVYQQTHISELIDNDAGNQFCVIYKDSRKNYWLGGKNGLIVKTTDNDIRWYHTGSKTYPLRHNHIKQIYEDLAHDIWLTTDAGVARYNPDSRQFIFYNITDQSRQRNARWAYDIKQDRKGQLWIATCIGGLFVVDKAKLLKHDASTPYLAEQNFSTKTSFTNNIYQLVTDNNNNIWVNTESGLVKINPETNTFTPYDCHPTQMVYDGNEYLWVSNYNKLYRFSLTTQKEEKVYELPDEDGQIYSLAIAENLIGLSSTEGITYLDRNTGDMQHFNLSQSYYEAGFYDTSLNRILWGGNDMLISFPLRNLHQKSRSTTIPIQIIAVYTNNKKLFPGKDYEGVSMRHQNHITLPYSSKNIDIAIAVLTYTAENNNIYYRLHKQKNWSRLPSGQNKIKLVNLNPGKYILEIRNGSSPDSSQFSEIHFSIRILPPWYASTMAYATYSLVFATLLFFAIRSIRLRLKREYEEVERYLNLPNMKIGLFMHISHELKTPLNQIITPVSKLIEEIHKDEPKHQLELVYKNAVRLRTLIHKILNIKQLDYEDENNLNKSSTELCSLTQSILECFSTSFKEKGIQASLICNPPQIWLEADTLKIESILLVLLSDIDKQANGQKGTIKISLLKQEHGVLLQLSDQGSGLLEKRYPPSLIQLFPLKTKKQRNNRMPGLYIIKKYIELHGGNIEFLCSNLKDGDRENSIRITLPKESCIEHILSPKNNRLSTASDANNAPVLLIACDNMEELAFLTDTFADSYICLTVLNHKDGLEIVRKQLPDLIITDFSEINNTNGLDFCLSLKRYQPTATIPLVMLATDITPQTELKSIKAGVDVYIPKPFDVSNLRLRLKQLLQTRRSIEKKIRVEHLSQPIQVVISTQDDDELFLSRITTLIEEQLENTEFSVAMLSDLSKTDKKQLNRRLKQLTGLTPVEYIRRLRLKKAAMLLSQKKLSVSEVMYKVGFSNASYFSKCFVNEFNMTPTQYMAAPP